MHQRQRKLQRKREFQFQGYNKIANEKLLCSPKSPRKRLFDPFSQKPKWNPRDTGQMQAVKEALHVATSPTSVVCREEEQKRVLEFCKVCIGQEKASSLYVCGCPGTGKTLSIDKVKEHMAVWSKEAIDLADRFLPKFESLNCKPTIVTFCAYFKDQILKILQQRLVVHGYDVFQPSTLVFCARKVAAASGDMGRALGVCRSAIEVLEAELRDATTKHEFGIVRFDHMDIALSKALKSAVVDNIQSLPQHQQGLLKFGQSREGKLKRVTLQIDSPDHFCFQGNLIFSEPPRVIMAAANDETLQVHAVGF